MAASQWKITPIGYKKTQRRLLGYIAKMEELRPLWEEIERELEQEERRVFDELDGRFVRTGATRDSLTQADARGAIREAHGETLVFGSGIWYSIFLRKHGTKGPSAVLVSPADMEAIVTRTVQQYIEDHESPVLE